MYQSSSHNKMDKKLLSAISQNRDICSIMEYIKNVLYFAIVKSGKTIRSTRDIIFFSIDDELVYENYCSDFGPLNLGCVYEYCSLLNEKLNFHLNKQQIIVHYTSIDPRKCANAAFLMGCYGIIYMNLTPKDALKPLLKNGQTYKPFQDATQGESMYTVTLFNCLQAIKKARDVGFFNFQDFNLHEYIKWNKVQGGDLNWIVPDKFIAFIGPVQQYRAASIYHAPEDYLRYFIENNVEVVIRLNKRMYEREAFTCAGIDHYDLYFPDGMCPPRQILFKFLQISENTNGALAVHCKAGLGRTGTLIGAYLIKHYRMTAREAISWMRICRSGSVIGHQQAWLEQLEPWLTKEGNLYRKQRYHDMDAIPVHEFGVYSLAKSSTWRKTVIRHVIMPPNSQGSKSYKKGETKVHKNQETDQVSFSESQSSNRSDATDSKHFSNQKGNLLVHSKKAVQHSSRSRGDNSELSCSRQLSPEKGIKKSEYHNKSFDIYMRSSLKITPQYQQTSKSSLNYKASLSHNEIPPSPFTSVFTSSTPMPYSKRRLGRSPSPSPTRSPTSPTPTVRPLPTQAEIRTKTLKSNDSQSQLVEALAMLKMTKPVRDHSLGSYYSVDAPHNAPAPADRFSSAKSDQRAVATQGDILNSIKHTFRVRIETLIASVEN